MELITERGESWRIDRLKKSADVFCTIVGISPQQLDLLVFELHDHKGTLQVYWVEPPSKRFMDAFRDAWALCGETACEHYRPGSNDGNSTNEDWGLAE